MNTETLHILLDMDRLHIIDLGQGTLKIEIDGQAGDSEAVPLDMDQVDRVKDALSTYGQRNTTRQVEGETAEELYHIKLRRLCEQQMGLKYISSAHLQFTTWLSQKTGIDVKSAKSYLYGNNIPTPDKVRLVAEALGWDMDDVRAAIKATKVHRLDDEIQRTY